MVGVLAAFIGPCFVGAADVEIQHRMSLNEIPESESLTSSDRSTCVKELRVKELSM